MELLDKIAEQETTRPRKVYITIEPFFDPGKFNLGLERYGKVLFDGIKQIEDLGSMLVAGTERYITGLDEFSPEVKALPDNEKQARVRQIRETVAKLELELSQNVIDVEDKNFWAKTTYMNPTNKEFWSKITLEVSSEPMSLDPTDPYDLIRIFAIEAGGFTMVAPSFDAAKKSNRDVKFYMSRLEDTSAIRTEIKKLRNQAKGELDKLLKAKQNKLFLVGKVFLAPENGFTRNTPLDVIYDKIDDKLESGGIDGSKKGAILDFDRICKLDQKTLFLKAYIRDAIFYRVLIMKSDKYYYTPAGNMCGKSIEDCTEYLNNPLNEKDLEEIIERIEKRWNN